MGNRVSDIRTTRHVVVGEISKADNKRTNLIKTSKYSILTFVPKNLVEQFRRLANFYFLIVTFFALVIDSPVSPYASLAPLAFVIAVTMAKQGYEDWLRHKNDNTVNNELVSVIRNSTLHQIKCHRIRPGDLVKIGRNKDVPCDAVLLWSSDPRGKCFVTTANLDGETSLKPLKVPGPLANTTFEGNDKIDIRIEILPPEPDIYTFYGKLDVDENKSTPVSTENLLLRGSKVKNTEWAIGCAIYTGEDTKLALNSKFTSNKFTSCESYINNYLIFFIVLMIAEILFSFFIKRYIEDEYKAHEQYLGPKTSNGSFKSIAQDTLSFLLLYYYCIPISLYVTIEMHKFIGSIFFQWDEDLYCSETDQGSLVNSSDLNEELGQIEILFSDKTGTLTKNDMYFQMCSINGELYIEKDTKLYEMNREWLNGEMTEAIETLNPDTKFFFKVLALCHTVQVEEESLKLSARSNPTNPTIPIYHAMSSDETAFVKAAANRGIIFMGDDANKLFIKYKDGTEEAFEKLQTIEFTSARRRMSVIVKNNKGEIWLFCKGAESAILPLCYDSNIIRETNDHVQYFAEQGLRTLAVAYKKLTLEEYNAINHEITSFNIDIHRRVSKNGTTDRWRTIEGGLTLLGATAVEDRLQDDVKETLESLRAAGVKIWVLTGDKIETAINVAQSCGHITQSSLKIYLTEILEADKLKIQLQHCINSASFANGRDLTLVLDGQSLALILGTPQEASFVKLSLECEAVICCRLSPLQKAQIVRLIKKSKDKPITAAIGDGANDISMIQEAHVGFGIFGKEGRQAARSADFSFSKFMMLKKVFLVHGHWYYERLATLVQYSFYKNLCLTNLMIFFQFNSDFSTQCIFDSMFLTCYNLVFTSVPILVLSLTEHCHSKEDLMTKPELYKNQSKNKLLSWKYFFGWCILGIYHSIIIYYFLYSLFHLSPVISMDGKPGELWCFGAAIFHCLIVVLNLKIWLQARYQTAFFIATVILSIVVFMIICAGYSYLNFFDDGDVIGTYPRLLSSPSFWFSNLLIIVATLQPDFTFKVYKEVIVKRNRVNVDEQNNININTLELTKF